ncbi:MAG: hypothetical protein Q9200_002738 [Gallowayella weberi]
MDIVGKDAGLHLLPREKKSFVLPPPAIAPAPSLDSQPAGETPKAAQTASDYSLPPPPTRTRKIIQMTPNKKQSTDVLAGSPIESAPAKTRSSGAQASAAKTKAKGKKQPSSTSQAGKRIARKTAHSVIERRRRSKMNEEFGVLKDMIPACKDQDMHKLAILQASIDYLRYLEQCITDLKTASGAKMSATMQNSPPLFQQYTPPQYQAQDEEDEEEDTDVEMTEIPDLAPLQTSNQGQAPVYTSPQSNTTSPALDAMHNHKAMSYTSSLSELPSPAIGPQPSSVTGLSRQYTYSTSTSPTLVPISSKEADEEATAALMMLNKDRRNTGASNGSSGGRGISVKDLLSS